MSGWVERAQDVGAPLGDAVAAHFVLESQQVDDVERQTRTAWERLGSLLEVAGFTPESIVRTNNILVDWRDYAGFNAGYGAHMPEPYVPRATVLGQLSDARARVQVEAIAHREGHAATILQVPPIMRR